MGEHGHVPPNIGDVGGPEYHWGETHNAPPDQLVSAYTVHPTPLVPPPHTFSTFDHCGSRLQVHH